MEHDTKNASGPGGDRELLRLEQEKTAKLTQELEDIKLEKEALIGKMAGVVGHEIRQPLAIINNSIYFIKAKLTAGGPELDPKIAKHIGIIEGEIKRGNGIIEEILTYSRTRELNRTPASVNAIIKDLAAYYQFPPSVTVKTIPDPADPRADIDVEAIARAARHILDNAAQAMHEGGTVTLQVSRADKWVVLTITDTGPGLPDGDGEKVFAPFFTTKPRGIGLNLPIVRKILEQHGGMAKAENAPGRGAAFTLYLPAVR